MGTRSASSRTCRTNGLMVCWPRGDRLLAAKFFAVLEAFFSRLRSSGCRSDCASSNAAVLMEFDSIGISVSGGFTGSPRKSMPGPERAVVAAGCATDSVSNGLTESNPSFFAGASAAKRLNGTASFRAVDLLFDDTLVLKRSSPNGLAPSGVSGGTVAGSTFARRSGGSPVSDSLSLSCAVTPAGLSIAFWAW